MNLLRPEPTEAERRILRWLAGPVSLVIAGAVIYGSCQQWRMQRSARQEAVGACVAGGGEEAECARRVDERDEACWDLHYPPGSKYRPSAFNAPAYRLCASAGPDAGGL